jgi:hypothetical protein
MAELLLRSFRTLHNPQARRRLKLWQPYSCWFDLTVALLFVVLGTLALVPFG